MTIWRIFISRVPEAGGLKRKPPADFRGGLYDDDLQDDI